MHTTENITRYVSGGYHPIAIGDVLGPTPESGYRIVHKLGYGSYATVWLAQKTNSSNSFVAVKVTTADSYKSLWRECIMLETACIGAEGSHILTLLDHFTLRGPNGIHYVLVMNVVVPLLSLLRFEFTPLWRKSVARDLTQAVAQLHTKRIVHGGEYAVCLQSLAAR
jgi:serine/threonine protein kinase